MEEEKKEPVAGEPQASADETVTTDEEENAENGGQHGKHPEKSLKKELKKAQEENVALSAQIDELTDKYKRMLAEYDNFRKRTQKERDGIYTDAYGDLLKQILPVKDSLEMAMIYADDSQLSKGVTMTLDKFNEILGRLGVEQFGEKGEPFNPELHNAVLHTEDETLGENVIAEVMLKGYKKGDKVLRFAMVKVAN
ncbi:MAG: nucleotide exchange factor GrpE [Clostridia bacterium]|nr:nucleotide exchange factor GrpE [Clostridia bacterium]MBR5005776.1 nucleotide exchange factor GrpE [Clostridia bacterium]